MKVFKQPTYTTACGAYTEWTQLKESFSGQDKVSVVDLRTTAEIEDSSLEPMPAGWVYRRLPIQANTISEQDLDVFRREQRRHGRMVVVGPTEERGCLLVLTDLARLARTGLDKVEGKDFSEEKALKTWLESYLERHASVELNPGATV